MLNRLNTFATGNVPFVLQMETSTRDKSNVSHFTSQRREGYFLNLQFVLFKQNLEFSPQIRTVSQQIQPFIHHIIAGEQKQDVSLSDIYMLSGLSLLFSSLTLNGLHEVTRPIFAHLHKQTEEGKKCFILNNVSLMSY